MTGLHSNWNGLVELVPNANFRGKKPFTCEILIDEALVNEEVRWRTLIHEALHAFSTGYTQIDFMANRGWEEGVVEQLQRIIRASVLSHLGVSVDHALFIAIEEEHAFNIYIDALESIRGVLEIEAEPFYLSLLKTPIKNRYSSLIALSRSMETMKQYAALAVLSKSNVILTRRTQ
jgi:hypothetical protein